MSSTEQEETLLGISEEEDGEAMDTEILDSSSVLTVEVNTTRILPAARTGNSTPVN